MAEDYLCLSLKLKRHYKLEIDASLLHKLEFTIIIFGGVLRIVLVHPIKGHRNNAKNT